jgi:hypothetical protein
MNMIPSYVKLWATVQGRPAAGVFVVVGWDTVSGYPYVAPLKPRGNVTATKTARVYEWDGSSGQLVLHESRTDADRELSAMVSNVRAVIAGAEALLAGEWR